MHVVVVDVYENSESREIDVVHVAILEDVLERPGADFHEFVLAYIPKLAVQHGLEMATGGIGRPVTVKASPL